MSNVDINVDRRTDGRTDGRTENRTPISHPATSRCDKKDVSQSLVSSLMLAQQDLVYCQEMIDRGPIREFRTSLFIFAWVLLHKKQCRTL